MCLPVSELECYCNYQNLVNNIVCTLEAAGYLKRNGEGQYEMSPDISPLLSRHFANRLVPLAEPVMSRKSLLRTLADLADPLAARPKE